jgi:hypothetical protein
MIKIVTRYKNTICTHYIQPDLAANMIKTLAGSGHVWISVINATSSDLDGLASQISKPPAIPQRYGDRSVDFCNR